MPGLPTFVVQLTPPGRGAIGVVLVAGPDAVAAVGSSFAAVNRKPLDEQPIGRILFGRWIDASAAEGEELVVCRRSADHVEIHPHGGLASVSTVIGQLVGGGCQQVAWNDWITRAEPDSIRAAAQIALADAPTERTAAILLDQYHGALRRAMESLADALPKQKADADREREALLARADIGRHLTRPWQVVLAGPPNVGKSSLVNAILGYTRAIVFDQPGTTRDVVTAATAIDGWPIELSDTAGLREGGNTIEVAGVELTHKQLLKADLVVWVDAVDRCEMRDAEGGIPSSMDPHDFPGPPCEADWHTEADGGRRPVYVLNKIDLLPHSADGLCGGASNVRQTDHPSDRLFTSATTGDGIPALLSAIVMRLVPDPPPFGAAVPFTEDQIEMIRTMQ